MFLKPFRTKTNTRIRGSERKELRTKIENTFSNYEFNEPITSIITNKDEINLQKIFTQKNKVVVVYMVNRNPLFFEVDKLLYPTVYFVWSYPNLIPSVTTFSMVISKLANGADLMLPGVITPLPEFQPVFSKGSIVAVNTDDNLSCVAVGIALISSQEMFSSEERQGKAVQIFHIFGDHLWESGERFQIPKVQHPSSMNVQVHEEQAENTSTSVIGIPVEKESDFVDVETIEESAHETNKSDTADQELKLKNLTFNEINSAEERHDEVESISPEAGAYTLEPEISDNMNLESSNQQEVTSDQIESNEEKMNSLLHNCFLTALKVKLKDKELPIPTGTFYRSKVLLCCPSGEFLDIKKTKYRKLSRYLKLLETNGLIVIKEVSKGIDHIVSVNRSHDDLKSFQPLPLEVIEIAENTNTETQFGVVTQKHYEPPEISQLYGINAATTPFFDQIGIKKGTVLNAAQVRQFVTDYVRENELVVGTLVTLDPVLHHTLFKKESADVEKIKWASLFSRFFQSMQTYHQLQFKGATPIVRKGEPPKIKVKLEQRMGNKKVTLVHNLESYFIRPQEFADFVKKKAQASISITALPGSKPNNPVQQVLIQGNQVRHVEAVLTGDSYKLPRKYIEGLESAPKSKGKSK